MSKPLKLKEPTFEVGVDTIYVNFLIPPNRPFVADAASYPMTVTDRRNDAVLENTEDYYLSIVRFNCPTQLIPICFMGIYQGIVTGTPNSNPNLTNYAIVLEDPSGAQTQQALIWTPENLNYELPPITDPITTAFVTRNLPYYSMFSYNTFIAMINTAFASAFTTASAQGTWPAQAVLPPFMTFDEKTGICYLDCQVAYDSTIASPIKIYFNSELMEFFQSSFEVLFNGFHPVSYATGSIMNDWQIVVRNRGNNYVPNVANGPRTPVTLPGTVTTGSPTITAVYDTSLIIAGMAASGVGIAASSFVVSTTSNSITLNQNATVVAGPAADTPVTFVGVQSPGYRMGQEFNATINWTDFTLIAFRTGGIPVEDEYSPLTIVTDQSISADADVVPIVTDFVPGATDGRDLRTFITYIPTSEYRLSNMAGGKPLQSMDLQVFWGDAFGNYFQIYCTHNVACSVKMMFRKKTFNFGGPVVTPASILAEEGKRPTVGGALKAPPSKGQCAKCASGGCQSCGGDKKRAVFGATSALFG